MTTAFPLSPQPNLASKTASQTLIKVDLVKGELAPPYRSYNHWLQEQFGGRVAKISVDPGFTCPNMDGTKGVGGCTFCDETGSSSRVPIKTESITEQILKTLPKMQDRFNTHRFIAYFQPRTNTYAPVAKLKAVYDEALAAHPDIMGLAISTRPDCVDEEKLALIASYQQPGRLVSIEYGLQSIHNRSLAAVNRCETVEDFETAYALTQQYGIDHCIHVILGLPGESWEDMMATANQLAAWRVAGVKIHLLVAMNKTMLAKDFEAGRWAPMERNTYIHTVCDFIERLHPECVIHRVAGNGHPLHVLAPRWMTEKFDVMSDIDAEFSRRGTRQGSHCNTFFTK
ncbi:MAG: TIGR01212 family radical SAM protein [Vampirovibrionales bacterium]|nr:TIGR01212 family radical SAM protein [Vampirovibrionales bacterium]